MRQTVFRGICDIVLAEDAENILEKLNNDEVPKWVKEKEELLQFIV